MPQPKKYPDYSWSFSRGEQFDNCQRAYYYARYEGAGGYSTYASERERLMYGLSKLGSLPLWKGNLVHSAMEHYANLAASKLKEARARRSSPSALFPRKTHEAMVQEVSARMLQTAKKDWARSLFLSEPGAKKQLWPGRDELLLQEHYRKTKGMREDSVMLEVVADAEVLVEEFADVLYSLLTPDSEVLAVEVLDTLPGFKAKVWVKSDLVLWRPDQDLVTILDWKTGRVNSGASYTSQLAIYAMWASAKFEVSPLAVSMSLVHPGQRIDIEPLSIKDIEEVKKHIARSIGRQASMLKSLKSNTPKSPKLFEPCSPTQSAPACRWCAYKPFCAEDCSPGPG